MGYFEEVLMSVKTPNPKNQNSNGEQNSND